MDARFYWRPDFVAGRPDPDAKAVVVVDVLSWSTTVTLAAVRGATIIPSGDRTTDRYWLSPATVRDAALPDPPRLTLPSPNGSALAATIPARITVVAGCLRNARAVAAWLLARDYESVAVVAAGEHWPSLHWRRSVEDFLGAGAILHALGATDPAAAAWAHHRDHAARHLHRCLSGAELTARGFAEDVAIASTVDADDTVALRVDDAFQKAV